MELEFEPAAENTAENEAGGTAGWLDLICEGFFFKC